METLLAVGSCVIGATQLLGMYLQGRSRTRARGYLVFLVLGLLLTPYNTLTGQWGFVVTNGVFCVLTFRAWRDVRTPHVRNCTGVDGTGHDDTPPVPTTASLTAQRIGPVGPVAGTND